MIACLETNRPISRVQPTREPSSVSRRQLPAGGAAEDELIRKHLPLVKLVVGQMAMNLSSEANPDDLYSSGLVGLLDAARKFDPAAGSSFVSYARIRIRGAVLDELRRMDWVPRSVHDKARKVQGVAAELEQFLGRAPMEAEIAGALQLSVEDYESLQTEIRPVKFIALDAAPLAESEGDDSQHDHIADESSENPAAGITRRELVCLITDQLEQLPQRQRQVVALYYFEDLRMCEIAATFGVTESRICQIHAQALRTLRGALQKMEAGID